MFALGLYVTGAAHAADTIAQWRNEANATQLLADNDAPRAYKAAQRLQAGQVDMHARQTMAAESEKTSVRMLELASQYQSESKQLEIDELNRRNSQQAVDLKNHELQRRWLWTVLGGSLMMLAGTAYFLIRQRRSNRLLEALNAQVRRSKNKLQATLDAVPDMLLELGIDGRCYDYHSPRVDLLAVPAEVLPGKTLQEILPPEAADVCVAALHEAHAKGTSTGMQYELELPQGSFWFELSVARKTVEHDTEPHFIALSRDITERKRAEEQLHAREQEFRAMVEHSPDIIARYDTQCRRIYVNSAMQAQFGLTLEQILGKTPGEFSPLRESQAYIQRIQSVLKTGREEMMEFSWIEYPGRVHWGHMRLAPEFGADGAVVSVLAITRDITERKLAEDALAAREREFRTLAENLPDNIIRYDLQARKTFVNSAVVRTLGTDSSLLIGKGPEESSLERIAEISEYEKILRHVLECGEPDEIEMAVPHASDGAQIHNIRFVAERDAQGKIVGALAIGRDTTAQKTADAALREREQRYHEIFDNAVEGMYLLEVTEDGRFRNLDINPALAASTGMPRETMIGKFVDDTVSEDIGRLIVEKYQRCVAAGKTIQESIELDLPSGKHYYYSTITPIYYDGHIRRLIGISRDITELKRVEHELEKSREQLRGLTARREKVREEERKYIAREIHDELGQILTGLQMDVSMLAYKFGNNIPALHEHLQGTLALVNKSLAVARNVAASLRPGSLDMGIVSAIEWLVERYSKNTGIKCEVHVCDKDRNIELNESASIALFRIAQESLTNVMRHAQASKVDIVIRKEGDEYLLEIRDNGKGFDAANTKAGSFGLLGIRERVYMLNGEMAIVSKPDRGTAISVRIPANNDSTGNNLSSGAA